jgi:hypothetical protein
MTIDEAISHAREVAECQKMSARLIEDNAYIPESVDKEAITYGNTICANEHEQLAEWLEELKQYRAIGTPEECKAATEKQTAKKPDYEGDGYSDGHLVYDTWICHCCGKHYEVDYDDYDFCPACGQCIDWSDEE